MPPPWSPYARICSTTIGLHLSGCALFPKAAPGFCQNQQQEWEPRTTLLSPFDNLICDRKRTARLFDFHYQSEIYTPKDKRRFGYYVMPILSGDQLIGRIDPTFDRSRKQLLINAVHTEPATAITGETGQAIAAAIEELAVFLGATTISYSHQLPEGWKQILT